MYFISDDVWLYLWFFLEMNTQCIYGQIYCTAANDVTKKCFLDKYETPMFKYVVYNCRFNVCDMFEKIPVMDRRGPDEFMMILLLQYLCFNFIYHILNFLEFLGSDLAYGVEKVAQITEL